MNRLAFSDDMMRALAANQKSMTRRPEKRLTEKWKYVYDADRGCLHPARMTSRAWDLKPRHRVGSLVAATCAYVKIVHFKHGAMEHLPPKYRFNSAISPEPQWKPARIMPAALAPFVLRITEVHAERLGEITELDAEREGAVEWFERAAGVSTIEKRILAAECFAELWNHVYGAGAWERDRESWVWAYGLEIAERRIG